MDIQKNDPTNFGPPKNNSEIEKAIQVLGFYNN